MKHFGRKEEGELEGNRTKRNVVRRLSQYSSLEMMEAWLAGVRDGLQIRLGSQFNRTW